MKIKVLQRIIQKFLERQVTIFHQFGITNSIRILFSEIIRKAFGSYQVASYSQTGEDRIIDCILLGQKTGFYVEFGCNDPQAYSNTYYLYKRGWCGITIDANEKMIKNHQKLRKQDISICAVISDKEQEAVFTDFNDSLVSSLDTNHINEYSKTRDIKQERVVKTVTLTNLLTNLSAPQNFDLLSIDVEGHDFEVLFSLDLHVFRPKLIVIEMHEFDFLHPHSNEIFNHLITNDYKMIGYITMNAYFVDTH